MLPTILLVNPPIYDFAAYDFWLKPYGLLSIAGYLRGKADFTLFDYLDRLHPFAAKQKKLESDRWGRGRFYCEQIPSPACLIQIPRYFRRFGLPRNIFQQFLAEQRQCDFVLIQTTMTYWYQGVQEVIQDIRKFCPEAKIILGGNYVTLCSSHAERLGADFLVQGVNLEPLWEYLNIAPDLLQPALWEAYRKLNVGALKLSDGCPFNCTYCSVPGVYGKFKPRPLERSLAELELLAKRGVENIAFYDDALLFESGKVLQPFLEEVLRRKIKVNLHSPNGLHARFITRELAELMVQAGFKTFYIGFESASFQWQRRTGLKVSCDELARAVENLTAAGAKPTNITAYQILGHSNCGIQQLEESMRFVNGLGIRGMLADFSPIPGTPDGETARKWVNMDEPLFHNKTVFPIILLGFDEVNRLKDFQRQLNRNLP
jgi:tRNA A37 methylthiotransferase MiaB